MGCTSDVPRPLSPFLQVLRYRVGEHYGPHWDAFEGEAALGPDGERVATVVLYLNTPEEGGETAFTSTKPGPDWHERHRGGPDASPWSSCGLSGYAARAVEGDALLFYSLTPSLHKDELSMHAGCPPVKGEKWVATKWIHTKPVRLLKPRSLYLHCMSGSSSLLESRFYARTEDRERFVWHVGALLRCFPTSLWLCLGLCMK